MLPVSPESIENVVPSARVIVPAVQETVSASKAEKVPEKDQPWMLIRFEAAATPSPLVSTMTLPLESLNLKVPSTLIQAGALSNCVCPQREPSLSVKNIEEPEPTFSSRRFWSSCFPRL